DFERSHVRARNNFEAACCLCLGDRGDRGRALCIHVAAAAIAKAVVHASRTILVRLRVDRGWSVERMPAERSGGCRHQIDEPGATQWRHRIFSLAAALK